MHRHKHNQRPPRLRIQPHLLTWLSARAFARGLWAFQVAGPRRPALEPRSQRALLASRAASPASLGLLLRFPSAPPSACSHPPAPPPPPSWAEPLPAATSCPCSLAAFGGRASSATLRLSALGGRGSAHASTSRATPDSTSSTNRPSLAASSLVQASSALACVGALSGSQWPSADSASRRRLANLPGVF